MLTNKLLQNGSKMNVVERPIQSPNFNLGEDPWRLLKINCDVPEDESEGINITSMQAVDK